MKKIILSLFIIYSLFMTVQSQTYLQSTTFIRSYNKTQLDSILDFNGLPSAFLGTTFKIDLYKMNYWSKDAYDTLVNASGLLIVPQDTCDLPMFAYSHGTISRKNDAPSRVNGAEPFIGMVMGSNGYLTIMPDYLGLGDGAG